MSSILSNKNESDVAFNNVDAFTLYIPRMRGNNDEFIHVALTGVKDSQLGFPVQEIQV